MNANVYATKDYENEPPSGPKKQTQNKPNSKPISSKAKMDKKLLAGKSGHTRTYSYRKFQWTILARF